MNLLQPSALWAMAVLPLLLVLYILRPRHRRLVVPSVRLWQHLPSDLEGQPRWRLPTSSWLLVVQLLIAVAVAVALARPAWPGATRQHLILLVDTSPTMLATDVQPDRLALAVKDARQLVGALGPNDQATLIAVGSSPHLVASGQGPHALDAALSGLSASAQRGDLLTALLLAQQTAEQSKDTHNRIVVLSDGALTAPTLNSLGPIPADVSYVQVGGSDDNQGITALSVRPVIGTDNRYVGFVQVTNFYHQPVSVPFRALADGLTIDQQPLQLPARGHVELALPLPIGTRHLVAQITTTDAYRADDQAEVLVPAAGMIPVTLVASDPGPWQQALKTLPQVALKVVNPESYRPDGAAVTILDDFVPTTLPDGNLLVVNPPPGNALVPVTGQIQNADVVHVASSNGLLRSVDLAGLYVARADHFGPVPWAQSLVDSTNGPLVLSGTQAGRQVVVIGFDPANTDWPQRISFPVFVSNAVQGLVPSAVPSDVPAGSVLDLPVVPGVSQVLVQLPNGKADVFPSDGRPIRFADTGQLGDYRITEVAGTRPLAQQEFVASRISVADSNIAPQVDPTQLTQSGGPPGQPSEHEVWPWVAGGALALLGAEWVLYFRRLTP